MDPLYTAPLSSDPMGVFVIKLRDLDAGEKAFRFPIEQDWLRAALDGTELSAPDGGVGSVRVRASKSGSDVLVRGEIDASVVATCARCTGPALVDVRAPVTVLFTLGTDAAGEKDDDGDDLDREHYTGETIELDPTVRDIIVVEIPIGPLCREDCPGLAPGAQAPPGGNGGRLDPRLTPLLRLKQSTKE